MTGQYKDKEKRKKYLREYAKNWRKKHEERLLSQAREKNARKRENAISHYSSGRMDCKICGYNDIRALAIDHIENNGNEHRKNKTWANIYVYLENNNYPEGYQVLCCNCNWIKYITSKKP